MNMMEKINDLILEEDDERFEIELASFIDWVRDGRIRALHDRG